MTWELDGVVEAIGNVSIRDMSALKLAVVVDQDSHDLAQHGFDSIAHAASVSRAAFSESASGRFSSAASSR